MGHPLRDGKLAVVVGLSNVEIIDCSTGVCRAKLTEKLFLDLCNGSHINQVFFGSNEAIVAIASSSEFGKNGFVIDTAKRTLVKTFSLDGVGATGLLASPDGKVVAVTKRDFISIRDIENDVELYTNKPRRELDAGMSIDGIDMGKPFFSTAKNKLIYKIENSWNPTGKLEVLDLTTKKTKLIKVGFKQIAIDVDFLRDRIVLTGSTGDLLLLDFEGELVAFGNGILDRRRCLISLSPNGGVILTGSRASNLSIFKVGSKERGQVQSKERGQVQLNENNE